MRVLHLIQRYWPARGGAESHLAELSERLVADGHDVTVATTDALDFELFWMPQRRRVGSPQERHNGVRIVRWPVRHLPLSGLAYPALRRLLWFLSAVPPLPVQPSFRLARLTPWVPDLWRWLETTDETYDLVAGMTICFEPLLEAGLRFARRRGVPFVAYPLTHFGAGPRPGHDGLSRFYTMRHQIALVQASDAVVAQTETERRFFEGRGLLADRIIVAGPGVDPVAVLGGNGERFRSRHGVHGPLVASVSSMSYDKGTVHLVEAARALWHAGRQVDLVLAGTLLEPFRHYLGTLPEADRSRLRVLGSIDDVEKRDLLAAADIFAMPSRTDSFGIVYLEAWLYRKPVIGARTWGVTDVILEGHNGRLVPFGDVPALAQTIAGLLDDPDSRLALGSEGERGVRLSHTWDLKYAAVRDLYQRLAKPVA